MHIRYILIFLLSFIPFAGHAEDYQLRVGQFDRLSVTDSVNVVYRTVPDSTGLVTFTANRDFADAIIYSVSKGELKISVSTEYVGRTGLPTVNVYSDFLTSATNGGTGTVQIIDPASVPQFKATVVGNGRIEISGLTANEVNAKITTGNGLISLQGRSRQTNLQVVGTGTIQADCLESETVKVKAFGGGSIGCWALDNLQVKCIGSTKIYYKGEPAIRKKGGGKLIPLE